VVINETFDLALFSPSSLRMCKACCLTLMDLKITVLYVDFCVYASTTYTDPLILVN
jgi:hypothetical protein